MKAKLRNKLSYDYLHSIGLVAGTPAEVARQGAEAHRHARRALQPRLRLDQERRVLHRQAARLHRRRPDPHAHRARAAGSLRDDLRRAVGGARRCTPGARLLHVHLGVREEHPLAVPRVHRTRAPLRAHVLRRLQARHPHGRDPRPSGLGLRRRRHRQRRLPLHALEDRQGPRAPRPHRPQRAARAAPRSRRRRRSSAA